MWQRSRPDSTHQASLLSAAYFFCCWHRVNQTVVLCGWESPTGRNAFDLAAGNRLMSASPVCNLSDMWWFRPELGRFRHFRWCWIFCLGQYFKVKLVFTETTSAQVNLLVKFLWMLLKVKRHHIVGLSLMCLLFENKCKSVEEECFCPAGKRKWSALYLEHVKNVGNRWTHFAISHLCDR